MQKTEMETAIRHLDMSVYKDQAYVKSILMKSNQIII